jgi:hypothetical protein
MLSNSSGHRKASRANNPFLIKNSSRYLDLKVDEVSATARGFELKVTLFALAASFQAAT